MSKIYTSPHPPSSGFSALQVHQAPHFYLPQKYEGQGSMEDNEFPLENIRDNKEYTLPKQPNEFSQVSLYQLQSQPMQQIQGLTKQSSQHILNASPNPMIPAEKNEALNANQSVQKTSCQEDQTTSKPSLIKGWNDYSHFPVVQTNEILAERENFQHQLQELKSESAELYNQALTYVNHSKQKDSNLDKELEKQRYDLEIFRRSIAQMQSNELKGANLLSKQPGIDDDQVVLKKSDLQKLLYKIDVLKKQAAERESPKYKSKQHSASKSSERSFSPYKNDQYYDNNHNENVIKEYQGNSHYLPSSSLHSKFQNLSYLSPKNFIEATKNLTKSSNRTLSAEKFRNLSPKTPSPSPGTFTPMSGYNKGRYNMKQLKGSSSKKQSNTPQSAIHPKNNYTINLYSLSSKNEPKKNQNLPISNYSSSHAVVASEGTSPAPPQPSEFMHSPSGLKTTPSNNALRQSFNGYSSSVKTSEQMKNMFSFNFKSPQQQKVIPNKFKFLKNRIFLVQKQTINSPFVQILGSNRLIVARLFKGLVIKSESNNMITDGNIYSFEKINLLLPQIAEVFRYETISQDPLKSFAKNFFVIGTKSSQKKQMQSEFVYLMKDLLKQRVETLVEKHYTCRVKVQYYSSLLTGHSYKIESNPLFENIELEFDPSKDLPQEMDAKNEIFDTFCNQIADLFLINKQIKKKTENCKPQAESSSSLISSKVRTVKFSIQTINELTVLSKQSYRFSTSNMIIEPEQRSTIQIFKDCFQSSSAEKWRQKQQIANLQAGLNLFISSKNPLGFKHDTALADENEFIFACSPIKKYTGQVQSLFKCAAAFEKLSRNFKQ